MKLYLLARLFDQINECFSLGDAATKNLLGKLIRFVEYSTCSRRICGFGVSYP